MKIHKFVVLKFLIKEIDDKMIQIGSFWSDPHLAHKKNGSDRTGLPTKNKPKITIRPITIRVNGLAG